MLLLSHLVFAQDSLKTVQLEEVAITAVRANEKAPVPQVTLSKKEINQVDIGQNAVLALEKLTPSVISYSDAGTGFGNYNQIRLRGMDQSRINITLNGVPLNDMIDQATYFSNFTDFSSSMQSVQVQRGVGITSNGTASYAGSISYESVNLGKQDPFGGLSISGGSFGALRINAEGASGRTEDDFSAYARVSRTVSDGYKDHSGTNSHSMFFSGAKFFENSILKFTALAGKTQNDQAYLPVALSDIKANPKTNYFDTDDTDDFEQEVVQLQYTTFLNENVSLNTTTYYNGSRGFFPFTFGDQFIYTVENDQYGFIGNLSYSKNNFSLEGGVHGYVLNRINEESIAPNTSAPYYSDQTDKKEISLFGKSQFPISEKLTGFVDLQLRLLNSTYTSDSLALYAGESTAERGDTFFNPKVGISYQTSASSSIYASFGRTGREPTRADLLVDPNNFSYIYSGNFDSFINDDLIKSEYVNDLEVGYRFSNNRLQFNVNAFHMSFENEIAAVGGLAANSYFPIRKNVKSSTRSGIELDAKYQLNEALSFGIISTYMNTNIDLFSDGGETFTDVNHAFAPDFQIAPSMIWRPVEKISIGVDGRYVSDSFMELSNDPSLTLPSYFVANAHVKWNVTERIELGVWVNNLFDKLYFTDGAPIDADFDGTVDEAGFRVQPPRNIFGSLKVRF